MSFCISRWFAPANTASLILLLSLMCFTGNITTQMFPLTPIMRNNGNAKQLSTAASTTPRVSERLENSEPSIFVSMPKLGANNGALLKMNNQGIGTTVGLGGSLGSGISGKGIIDLSPSTGINAGELEVKDRGLGASVGMDISSGSGIQGPKIGGSLTAIAPDGAGLGVQAQGIGPSIGIGASLDSSIAGSGNMKPLPSIEAKVNTDISEEIKGGGLGLSVGLGGSLGSGNSGKGINDLSPSTGMNAGALDVKDRGLGASVGMDISSGSGIQGPKIGGSLTAIAPDGAGLGVQAQGIGPTIGIGASLDSSIAGSGIMKSIPSIEAKVNTDISEEIKGGGLGLSVGLGGSLGSGNSGKGINDLSPSTGMNAGALEVKDRGLGASVGMDISSGSGIQGPKIGGSLTAITPDGAGLGVQAQGIGPSIGIGASLDSSIAGSGIMKSIPSIEARVNTDISEEIKGGRLGLSVGLGGSLGSGNSGKGINDLSPSTGINAGALEVKDRGLGASVGMDISSGPGIQGPKIGGSLTAIAPDGAGLGVQAQGMGPSIGIGASLDSSIAGSGIMKPLPSIEANVNTDISEEIKGGGLGLSVGLGGSLGSGNSGKGINDLSPSTGINAGALDVKDRGLGASVGMDISSGSGIQGPKLGGSLTAIAPDGAGLGVQAQGIGPTIGIGASLDSSIAGSGIMKPLPSIEANVNTDISEEIKGGGLGLSVGLGGSLGSGNLGKGINDLSPSTGINAGALDVKDRGLGASVGMDISSGSGIQGPKIGGSLTAITPDGAGLGVQAQGIGPSIGIGASLDSSIAGSGIMKSIPSIEARINTDISEEIKGGRLGLSVGLGGSLGSGNSGKGINDLSPSTGINAGALEVKDRGLGASVGMDISSGPGIQGPKIGGSLTAIAPDGAGLGVQAQGMGPSIGIGASLDSSIAGSGIMKPLPSIEANVNTDISEEIKGGGLGLSVGLGGSLGSGNSGKGINDLSPSTGINAGALEVKDRGLGASVGMDISSGPGIQGPKIGGSLTAIAPDGAGLGMQAQGMGPTIGIGASLDSNNLKSKTMVPLPSVEADGIASISEVKDEGFESSVGVKAALGSNSLGSESIRAQPSVGVNGTSNLSEVKQGLGISVGMEVSLTKQAMETSVDMGSSTSINQFETTTINLSSQTETITETTEFRDGQKEISNDNSMPQGFRKQLDLTTLKTLPSTEVYEETTDIKDYRTNVTYDVDEGFEASVGVKAALGSNSSGSESIRAQPSVGVNGTSDLSEVKQGLGISVGMEVSLTKQAMETSVDMGSSTSVNQFETTTINLSSQTETITDTTEFRDGQKEISNDNSMPQGFRKQLDLTTLKTLPSTEVYEETTDIKDYQTMYDVDVSTSSSENLGIVDKQPTTFEYSEPMGTSSVSTEKSSETWIQKIPTTEKLQFRMPKAPPQASAEHYIYSGKAVWFGQIITNVLYGAPWSAYQTNSKCVDDMRTYNMHVQNYTLWASKMLDATSKGPEGLLDGNTFSFGNFDQCMSTKSKTQGISGGYSLVDIDFRPSLDVYPGFYDGDHSKDYDPPDEDKSMWEAIKHNVQEDFVQRHMYQWAVCLPDTCQSEDVQKIVSNALVPELKRFGFEANVTINPLLHTSIKNTFKYTAGFYFVCAMYASVAIFVFIATLYDLIYLQYRPKSKHGPMKQIMKPFSLISNLERLLKPSETEEFSIINGLKVCAILQVIIGHRWFMEFGNPQSNPIFVHWVIHNVWFGYFKCTIFLETFFVISGFLTFHIITKQLTEKKRLNFIPIMIYRWLRIFPVYGTLIATYIFILPYLNDGPYWREIIYRESERCQNNWWTNMLFINNYVHTDQLCIIPSWYLACDMHFFVIGTLLTYAIWKWTKPGLLTLGACLIASTIIPAYVILKDQHWGTAPVTPDALHDLSKDRFYTNIYIKSHMRAMTYLIGILAGYVYMKLKEADYKLSLNSRIFWAPVVLMIGNCIYLSSGIFFALGHKYVAYEHAIYFTLGRLVWSVLICYGIIGHGLSRFGVCISDFLGHRIFHVTGKLVFCIYMFQEIIQLQTIASMRTPTYQNLTLMTWRFGGDTLMAMMYAFAINVMIESPFDRLQKNIMKLLLGDMFSKPKPSKRSIRETIDTTITTSTTTLYVVNYSGDEQFSVS